MQAYLDNSATTRPSDGVIESMAEAMRGGYFNPSSLYAPAMRAEKAMEECREAICRAISAPAGRAVFTSGGTEANNLAILGSVGAMHGKKRVIRSAVEHPSVEEAFAQLAREGHEALTCPVGGDGRMDLDALDRMLTGDTALVSCMQVNNETGARSDIARISGMLRSRCPDALLHVDGVQGFMRVPFSARCADLYTLSAHKIHGPKGVGALWIRRGVRLLARQMGGGQEGALRSGTENTPGIAGLFKAIREREADPDAAARMMGLKMDLINGLCEALPEAVVNGPSPADAAPHIVNISFPGVRAETLLHALEAREIYVSTGSACSAKKRDLSRVLIATGVDAPLAQSALRFSLSPHTTPEEILWTVQTLPPLYRDLKRYRRK